MKIIRRPLDIRSLDYSREYDVDRSTGCHLMQVVDYIAKTSKIEKAYKKDVNLEPFATAGFLWEHVMTRTDRFERAFELEALRMQMIHRPELSFPGERFWCRQCDVFMKGGSRARKHCRIHKHKGIYFTPDAYDTELDAYCEFKFSWKSSKRSDPRILHTKDGIWRWPVQCMFNAYGLDTNRAVLTVLHCMGEYAPGMPKPKAYEIDMTFSDREMQRTFSMIVTNAKKQGWI